MNVRGVPLATVFVTTVTFAVPLSVPGTLPTATAATAPAAAAVPTPASTASVTTTPVTEPVVPTATPKPVRTTKPNRNAPRANREAVWDRLAECESTSRWDYNGTAGSDSGYDGGLQFSPTYWPHYAKRANVNTTYAWQATRTEQIKVAELILADIGWKRGWPVCSRELGYR